MPLNILIHGLQAKFCVETYNVVGTCGSQVKVYGDNYWREHKMECSGSTTLDLQARSDDATYVFEKKSRSLVWNYFHHHLYLTIHTAFIL